MSSAPRRGERPEDSREGTGADETVVVAAEGADETIVVAAEGADETVVVAAEGADETVVVAAEGADETIVVAAEGANGTVAVDQVGGENVSVNGNDSVNDDDPATVSEQTDPNVPEGAFRAPATNRPRLGRPGGSQPQTSEPRVGVRRGISVLTPIRLEGSNPAGATTDLEAQLGSPPTNAYPAPEAMRDNLPSLRRVDRKTGVMVTLGFVGAVVVSVSGLIWVASMLW